MRTIEFDNGGVRMTAVRQQMLRHASDLPDGHEECFGGDTMGHWNVARINRLLDAFAAPVVAMPIPRPVILSMARVGKPDEARARAHAARGIAGMPPLSFVSFEMSDELKCLLVDGHHRMLALHYMGADSVPARVLPPSLADDVRIVEIAEAVVFPAMSLPRNSVRIGGAEQAA